MDYMSGLLSTKHGNDCVFVVVDQFSKMVVLAPCKKSITTEATTNLFFEHVWVHFGHDGYQAYQIDFPLTHRLIEKYR
jgi:hypothetical protein